MSRYKEKNRPFLRGFLISRAPVGIVSIVSQQRTAMVQFRTLQPYSGIKRFCETMIFLNKSPRSASILLSYLRTALRNMKRQKLFNFINVACLSVGMSVGLLALAVSLDIIKVDDFHQNASRIYRVVTEVDNNAGRITYASTSAQLAEHLRSAATGIDEIVQLDNLFKPAVVLSPGNTMPFKGYYATPNFFKAFDFALTQGSPQHALERPFTAVISEKVAATLFRDVSPVGKILELDGLGEFQITGVMAAHDRTHFNFDMLASFSTIPILEKNGKRQNTLDSWGPVTSSYTYVLLSNDTRAQNIEASLTNIYPVSDRDANERVAFSLQSLSDISLSELYNEIGLSWGATGIVVFLLLALMCLVPACFNYTNVSIARALKRAKEIGVRKVSGGGSRQIFIQMILETVVLSLISLCVAFILFYFIRREYLDITNHSGDSFHLEITPALIGTFMLFAIATGLLAGLFPALYFSRLSPVQTLRSSFVSANLSKVAVRKGLIITQFTLSMVFILGVGIVIKQYRYAINYDPGYNPDNVMVIQRGDVAADALQTQLSAVPGVEDVAMSSSSPGGWTASKVYVKYGVEVDSSEVFEMFVDHRYLDVLQMPLIAGSSFPPDANDNDKYVIVNETFLSDFNVGAPVEALGKPVKVGKTTELVIIGVVKDFNFAPIQKKIQSFFFRSDRSKYKMANVRVANSDKKEMIDRFEGLWRGISAQRMDLVILEDALDHSLKPFRSIIKAFTFLAFVAIMVSCLGLLAVVISVTESRTRELSIRKIVGASRLDLARSLLAGFAVLILIAVLIAVPSAYFLFDKVLLSMIYYHAPIGSGEIILSVMLLLVIAATVLGSQLVKVVRLNPADTLKSE